MKKMKKRKMEGSNRAKASLKEMRTHSDKIGAYKYDSKPGVIMSDRSSNPSPADRELKRLMQGDVFRSNPQTVKQTNSSSRRYK